MKKTLIYITLLALSAAFMSSCKNHYSCNTYVKAEKANMVKERI